MANGSTPTLETPGSLRMTLRKPGLVQAMGPRSRWRETGGPRHPRSLMGSSLHHQRQPDPILLGWRSTRRGGGTRSGRVNREEKSNCHPYIWKNPIRTEIITPGSGKSRAYDLDGKLLWELSGSSHITIPTPFSRFDLLYLSSGYVWTRSAPSFAILTPGPPGHLAERGRDLQRVHSRWCQPHDRAI